MAGLVGVGQNYKDQAKMGLQDKAQFEEARENTANQIEMAEKSQKMSAVGTGAGMGMMIGGPAGAAIGAGIGLLASELF